VRRNKRAAQAPGGVRTGTLTLLLLVTAIVLSVIAVLALQTARSNLARADAFANNVEQFYKNDAAGQTMLADLDELLEGGGSLTVGDVRAIVPEQFTVTANRIQGAYIDGQPRAYDSINLESKTYNDGIATDGRSDVDATSSPALMVEVQIGTKGYKIQTWTHVRAYDEADIESESSLFTGVENADEDQVDTTVQQQQQEDGDAAEGTEGQGE